MRGAGYGYQKDTPSPIGIQRAHILFQQRDYRRNGRPMRCLQTQPGLLRKSGR